MDVLAPLSIGDLADRITILRIKSQRIIEPFKLSYIGNELARLEDCWGKVEGRDDVAQVVGDLQAVNTRLWVLEDEARTYDLTSSPERALDCLRAITRENDLRAKLKRQINARMGSAIVEMKSHR